MSEPTREPMTGATIIADIDNAVGNASHSVHDSTEWWEAFYKDGSSIYDVEILPTVQRIAAAYDAIVDERDAAVRELEETRKREALSDAIVDECDSDITALVQERATLRARLAACERVVEAANAFVPADTGTWKMMALAGFIPDEQAALGEAVAAYRAAVAAETQGGKDADA